MCLGVFPTQPLLEFLAFTVPNPNPISKSHSKYQIPVPSHSPVPLAVPDPSPKAERTDIRLSSAGSPPNVCRIWQWDMGLGFWEWDFDMGLAFGTKNARNNSSDSYCKTKEYSIKWYKISFNSFVIFLLPGVYCRTLGSSTRPRCCPVPPPVLPRWRTLPPINQYH